jgi:hypothetical protein
MVLVSVPGGACLQLPMPLAGQRLANDHPSTVLAETGCVSSCNFGVHLPGSAERAHCSARTAHCCASFHTLEATHPHEVLIEEQPLHGSRPPHCPSADSTPAVRKRQIRSRAVPRTVAALPACRRPCNRSHSMLLTLRAAPLRIPPETPPSLQRPAGCLQVILMCVMLVRFVHRGPHTQGPQWSSRNSPTRRPSCMLLTSVGQTALPKPGCRRRLSCGPHLAAAALIFAANSALNGLLRRSGLHCLTLFRRQAAVNRAVWAAAIDLP